MYNSENFEKTEIYQGQIKELFKEFGTDELYNTWADTFDIFKAGEKQVVVSYHGVESIKVFKKKCKKLIFTCVNLIAGKRLKVKIVKQSVQKVTTKTLSPKAKKNIKALNFFIIGMVFVCVATAIVLVLGNYIGNRNFRETFYTTSSIKVNNSVRVIQLSDLHNASYGKDNSELIKRVKELNPDIILCTGDMVNSATDDAEFAVSLAKKLSEIAPAYYIYGNNEVETVYDVLLNEKDLDEKFGFDSTNRDESALRNLKDPFEEKLEAAGIKVLKNEKDTIKVKNTNVDIFGVLTSNPSSFWSYSGKSFAEYIYEESDNLKITAVHEPFVFEEFDYDSFGDLMVCGHTHGGVIRVPILGPLFTKEGGLFPERSGKFVYGRYSAAGRPLIVSGGLENSNIFRMNNQPELVVIDINKF